MVNRGLPKAEPHTGSTKDACQFRSTPHLAYSFILPRTLAVNFLPSSDHCQGIMAEALAAIGLASSIIAFVDIAQKVVFRLNEFSNVLEDSTNALVRIQTQLPLILDGLRRIKDRADSDKLNDGAKAALEPVALQCHKQTQRLSDILDRVLPASDASKWERRKKAILSLTTDRKVKEISEALGQYLQTSTFYHSIGEARPDSVVKKAFWLVPFDRNPAFVGRDAIFEQIDQSFNVPEGTQPKVALVGLGGIG